MNVLTDNDEDLGLKGGHDPVDEDGVGGGGGGRVDGRLDDGAHHGLQLDHELGDQIGGDLLLHGTHGGDGFHGGDGTHGSDRGHRRDGTNGGDNSGTNGASRFDGRDDLLLLADDRGHGGLDGGGQLGEDLLDEQLLARRLLLLDDGRDDGSGDGSADDLLQDSVRC